MSTRTLVMGDIHGNLAAFKQCLERCGFDIQNDLLIQLGDVSDRHHDTAAVVEHLIQIPNLIAIRGNHDTWTGDWLLTEAIDPVWLHNGGEATIKSYRKDKAYDRGTHARFFKDQVDYFVDTENRVFVHGGFTHEKGPQAEIDSSTCYWDRSLWREALAGVDPNKKPKRLKHFEEVYIGHTPTLNWYKDVPMNAFNVWNLDTGAGTTGKLTVMDIETKEYWQSD